MTDLASWDAFERDHPGTFSGMYQFWVQRKSAAGSPPPTIELRGGSRCEPARHALRH